MGQYIGEQPLRQFSVAVFERDKRAVYDEADTGLRRSALAAGAFPSQLSAFYLQRNARDYGGAFHRRNSNACSSPWLLSEVTGPANLACDADGSYRLRIQLMDATH